MIAAFSNRMISQSVTLPWLSIYAAAGRVRHPSAQNSSGPRSATTASFPCSEMTVILTLSFLDVEHRVRRIALPEDRLVLSIFGDGSAPIHGGEKYHRVKGDFFQLLCHDRFRFTAPHGQNSLTFGPNASSILRPLE